VDKRLSRSFHSRQLRCHSPSQPVYPCCCPFASPKLAALSLDQILSFCSQSCPFVLTPPFAFFPSFWHVLVPRPSITLLGLCDYVLLLPDSLNLSSPIDVLYNLSAPTPVSLARRRFSTAVNDVQSGSCSAYFDRPLHSHPTTSFSFVSAKDTIVLAQCP